MKKILAGILGGMAILAIGCVIMNCSHGILNKPLMAEEVKSALAEEAQPEAQGWLGVILEPIDPALRAVAGLKADEGVLLRAILKYGPADKAKLAQYDIILKVDNQSVKSVDDLQAKIRAKKPDESVSLTILRSNKEINLPVVLGGQAPMGPQGMCPGMMKMSRQPETQTWLGIVPDELSPAIKGVLNLKDEGGILVAQVLAKSPAEEAKLQKYDIILKLDKEDIKKPQMLVEKIKAKKSGDKIMLTILRQGKEFKVDVTLGSHTVEAPEMEGMMEMFQQGMPKDKMMYLKMNGQCPMGTCGMNGQCPMGMSGMSGQCPMGMPGGMQGQKPGCCPLCGGPMNRPAMQMQPGMKKCPGMQPPVEIEENEGPANKDRNDDEDDD
jgi:membrane-associated protease RseP (regulator of RpoE activity)